MNKQAYEKSVGLVISKQAAFDWNSVLNALKTHWNNNKQHYIRGAAVGVPAMLFGGLLDGRRGAGLGLLAGLVTAGGSKGWDWLRQNAQNWYDKGHGTGYEQGHETGYEQAVADLTTVGSERNDTQEQSDRVREAQDWLYNNDPTSPPPRNK